MASQERELIRKFADLDTDRSIRTEAAFAEAQKVRMEAIGPRLVEALTAMAMTGQLEKIAEHLAPLAIVQGTSLAGTLNHLMAGTPLEGMLRNFEGLNRLSMAGQ